MPDDEQDRNAQYLAGEIAKLGPIEIIFFGSVYAGTCQPVIRNRSARFTWPPGREKFNAKVGMLPDDLPVQRIIVRHDFSRDFADLLLADYKRAMAQLKTHPLTSLMTADEASGFHH